MYQLALACFIVFIFSVLPASFIIYHFMKSAGIYGDGWNFRYCMIATIGFLFYTNNACDPHTIYKIIVICLSMVFRNICLSMAFRNTFAIFSREPYVESPYLKLILTALHLAFGYDDYKEICAHNGPLIPSLVMYIISCTIITIGKYTYDYIWPIISLRTNNRNAEVDVKRNTEANAEPAEPNVDPVVVLTTDTTSSDTDTVDDLSSSSDSTKNTDSSKPTVIAIAGGSGSGKTYMTNRIVEAIKSYLNLDDLSGIVAILELDQFIIPGDHTTNYDDPVQIEWSLVRKSLLRLINGKKAECPIYNFKTHQRELETVYVMPAKIIIIEGAFALYNTDLCTMFDLCINVHADPSVQIIRRIRRDMIERERSMDYIMEQIVRDVWPGYKEYIRPSAKNANVHINNNNGELKGIDFVIEYIISTLDTPNEE